MKVNLFVLSCAILCGRNYSLAKLLVHPDTPQCQQQGTSLTCKFDGVVESVFVDDLSKSTNGRLTTVYIHQAKKLFVQRPNCVDLSLYNIESVMFVDNRICEKKINSLRLVDSRANQVPRQLNRLELTRSTVGKIICDMGLQRMTIVESQVGEFMAPWPIGGVITLKISDSNIENFLAMNIETRTTLVITNSTIGHMGRESLILGKGASAYISRSTVDSEENSIIVKNGAQLTLRDTMGKVMISGSKAGDEETRRPPGVPDLPTMITPDSEDEMEEELQDSESNPEQGDAVGGPSYRPCRRNNVSIWAWLFPTVIATVEAVVLIVMCGQRVSKMAPIIHKKNDFEAADAIEAFGNNYYNMAPTYGNAVSYDMGMGTPNNSVEEFYDERQSPYIVRRR